MQLAAELHTCGQYQISEQNTSEWSNTPSMLHRHRAAVSRQATRNYQGMHREPNPSALHSHSTDAPISLSVCRIALTAAEKKSSFKTPRLTHKTPVPATNTCAPSSGLKQHNAQRHPEAPEAAKWLLQFVYQTHVHTTTRKQTRVFAKLQFVWVGWNNQTLYWFG